MASLVCNCFPPPLVRKWNESIKGNVLGGDPERAIETFVNAQELGFQADNYTFPVLLKAAGSCCNFRVGSAFHGQTIKTGYFAHDFVQTALINMYSAFNRVVDCFKVFDHMPVKDVVAWNSMLDAYASNGQMDNAMHLFGTMPEKNITSYNVMVSGYSSCGKTSSARSVFDAMPEKDVVSWNSMILGYTIEGDMRKAGELFRKTPAKTIITWNTMITGFLQNELYDEVIDLFDEMKSSGCMPDYLTVASALSACARSGSLVTGRNIHVYAINNGVTSSPQVTASLIDMYAKCGSIQHALMVFYKSHVKNIYCWNATMCGLALHGRGYAALKLLDDMRNTQIRPDDITFIGVLSACSHSGLVEEGTQLFDCMQKEFGISPKLEHYGCMADLLGRSGHLKQALLLVEAMPFEPGESILGALLSACVIHRDLENGERIMKLVSNRAEYLSDGELMMFSNLYAACGQWEEANRWRGTMNDTGIVKTAGFSVIEINGTSHRFLAGEEGKS